MFHQLFNKLKTIEKATLVSAGCACVIGLFLFFSPLGDPLARLSFDVPFLFRPKIPTNDVIIVTMDESTYSDQELNAKYSYPDFDRSTHAEFLKKLKSDGARMVAFDLFFKKQTPEDEKFAAAITNHGNVVLGADLLKIASPDFLGHKLDEPARALRDLPGSRVGLVKVRWDSDGILREFPLERTNAPSFPVAAAEAVGLTARSLTPNQNRYVAYYGDQGTLVWNSYQFAYNSGPGYFKDKIVFIGGKPTIVTLGETTDFFSTPFSRWGGAPMPGVEVHATMFLNLLRHDWLTRLGTGTEFMVILAAGTLFGVVFSRMRPVPGLSWLAGFALVISILAIVLFWSKRVWFDWALVSGVQTTVAWASAALVYSRKLLREKQTIEKEKETILEEKKKLQRLIETIRSKGHSGGAGEEEGQAATTVADIKAMAPDGSELKIDNFVLLKRIGEGAYGEVWLTRSVTKALRAIKIVYRNKFDEQRPFEREFEGVRSFEPISLDHPGWVYILYVGKDAARGFFYYVMEPADDLITGAEIDPETYEPKTLGKLLVENGWLSVDECTSIGVHLADALAALHKAGLVHRDIKPSNIIFVKGLPKLADIGLVTPTREPMSIAGTEGFIPKDKPGTPLADIFALGRTLYQAATGCEPSRHPGLPTSLGKRTDGRELMRLMEIINKACAHFPEDRYQSAAELRDDLQKFQSSLRRRRSRS